MTTTILKLLALVFMLIDHIGQFIPETPNWFRWIGRISAPLFIYCVILGYSYTSNKKKYLTRLYLFGVGMAIVYIIINFIYKDTYYYITNNFFTTLFLIGFIIFLIDKKEKKYFIGFLIWQLVSTVLCVFLVAIINVPNLPDALPSFMFYGSLFGNVLLTEGGVPFVILGLLLFITRKNKRTFIMSYSGFSLLCYFLVEKYGYYRGIVSYLIPFADYQWMMIAALPFMLLYNGKKGSGLKYFFYIFYPLHIVILYLIGHYLK